MKSAELRQRFCDFFISQGHRKVSSSSIIPENDPTLLFANAGMNQFKDYFTGKDQSSFSRAVTVQKCVRAGGKHNDLENVGFTARHHTFFEMLGNFSFGDYFKKEAIHFAWKFLTQDLKIPKEKLLITVHHSDEEARNIWHEQEKVPLNRIFSLGDKDNFWEMGEFGPCGPCTEIFYDHGEAYAHCAYDPEFPLKDEGRFVEIWNLVFMQFEKTPNGVLTLPKPSVDTGAGLERLSAAMQGVYWNYDSDLFSPIISHLSELSKKSYQDPKFASSMRVIADHVRSSTMLITDGAMPSSEGRGYVLRRIMRRAVRHMEELGIKEPALHLLVPNVFDILGDEYPQNKQNATLASKILKQEESSFRETLSSGMKMIQDEIQTLKKKNSTELSGLVAFKLYDTFGFPLDLTEIILREKNLSLNQAEFDAAMKQQKANSRAHSNFKANSDQEKIFFDLRQEIGATEFVGYNKDAVNTTLVKLIPMGNYTAAFLSSTPFYGESGGQAGDTGSFTVEGKTYWVINTQKVAAGDLHMHLLEGEINISTPVKVRAAINKEQRQLTARNHSATHLLQAALVEVLGDHVKQAGSQVTAQSLRFDFTHHTALTAEQKKLIEAAVNKQIENNLTSQCQLMSKEEAVKNGAMALFGEKYGDVVRVISFENYSKELCGGTHVSSTGSIQLFTLLSESSLSSGVRRIEAMTSTGAIQYLQERSQTLQKIEQLTSTSQQVDLKIEEIMNELKEKSKELQAARQKNNLVQLQQQLKNPEMFGDLQLYCIQTTIPVADWKAFGDSFSEQFKNNSLLCLYSTDTSTDTDKMQFLLRSHTSLTFDCNMWVKKISAALAVKGGGRKDMVQGSLPLENKTQFLKDLRSAL